MYHRLTSCYVALSDLGLLVLLPLFLSVKIIGVYCHAWPMRYWPLNLGLCAH